MFDGIDTSTRDPRKSCTWSRCPCPSMAWARPFIAVMASAVNYNTVWSSIFSPVSTFAFLRRYGKLSRAPPPRHELTSR